MNSPLSTIPTSALGPMVERAYREAVRCWAEVRDAKDPALRATLLTGAEGAEVYWRDLRDELVTREGATVLDPRDEAGLDAIAEEAVALAGDEEPEGYEPVCPACGHRYSDGIPTRADMAHDAVWPECAPVVTKETK